MQRKLCPIVQRSGGSGRRGIASTFPKSKVKITCVYLFLNINLLCSLHNLDLHFFFFDFLFCYGSLKFIGQFRLGFLD